MTDRAAELKAAEQRGYARGYQAGKKRKQREHRHEQTEKQRKAFAERVFIAVLPYALKCQNWTMGEVKVTTTEQRIDLAMKWVERALRKRYSL